jgi:hypothetical protein
MGSIYRVVATKKFEREFTEGQNGNDRGSSFEVAPMEKKGSTKQPIVGF